MALAAAFRDARTEPIDGLLLYSPFCLPWGASTGLQVAQTASSTADRIDLGGFTDCLGRSMCDNGDQICRNGSSVLCTNLRVTGVFICGAAASVMAGGAAGQGVP